MTATLQTVIGASSYVGAWETDLATQTVELTSKVADMLGIDRRKAASGVPVTAFVEGVHPDDREEVAHRIHEAHSTAGRFEAEFRTVDEGHQTRFVLARGRVETKEQGQGMRCVGIIVDITDSRSADHPDAAEQVRIIKRIIDALVEIRSDALRLGSSVLQVLIDTALFELGTQLAKHVEHEKETVH